MPTPASSPRRFVLLSLALWLALVALVSAVDPDCQARLLRDAYSSHRRLADFTIDMTTGDNFKRDIRAARVLMNAANVRTLNRKNKFCYATGNWRMSVTLPDETVIDVPMGPDQYMLFPGAPVDYPRGAEYDTYKWNLLDFQRAMKTPTEKRIYFQAFSLAEAIRFDWVMNRIATAIDARELHDSPGFLMPKKDLLNAWGGSGKPIGIAESTMATILATKGFVTVWSPSNMDAPATYPDEAQ